MKKDIYIIKNSVNDKVYIGQAKSAAERWLSHIYNATYETKTNKNIQVIHKAMAKYGYDKFHYEILEYQIENYDEREQYWIDYYNSRVPNGYNVALGGKSAGTGISAPTAVFKTSDDLNRCISEISSSTKSFSNIARKYGCSYEVISAINSGKRYRQDTLSYPLRNTDARYDHETLKQVRYSLKYECDLTLKDVTLTAGGKPVTIKSGKFALTLINSTVGAVNGTGSVTIQNSTVGGAVKAGKLTIDGNVIINGAVTADELNSSADNTTLTLQSLTVKKNGVAAGSKAITLRFIDAKGNALTFAKAAKGDTVIVKSYKDSKITSKDSVEISSLILSSDNGSGKLVFSKNKLILG